LTPGAGETYAANWNVLDVYFLAEKFGLLDLQNRLMDLFISLGEEPNRVSVTIDCIRHI
jgi:hypothetical protein